MVRSIRTVESMRQFARLPLKNLDRVMAAACNAFGSAAKRVGLNAVEMA
jgi:hypothetical protein